MIAFVFGVILSSILVTVDVEGGRVDIHEHDCAPAILIASDVAIKLFAAVITSSPGPTPSVLRARNSASVPFATPTQ